MKKITIIIVIFIALALLVAGVFLVIASHPANPVSSSGTSTNPFGFASGNSNEETSASSTNSSSKEISIQTNSSSTVAVPDFTSGKTSVPVGTNADDVQYNLTPYPPYTPGKQFPTHQFDVQYNNVGSQFIVTLNQEPIGEARTAAENFMEETLKVPAMQLCSLNIDVSVPYTVNQEYSQYENLGLSFCPGAVALPE
jgi:hypothetical protein